MEVNVPNMPNTPDTSPEEQPAYTPNMPYNTRQNTASMLPRVQLPAVSWIDYQHIAIGSMPSMQPTYTHNQFGNPQTMQNIASSGRAAMPVISESGWDFKDRYKVQEITPILFLGPLTATKDPNFLDSANITFLLGIRDAYVASKYPSYLKPRATEVPGSCRLETFDVASPFDMVHNIRPVIRMLVDHVEASSQSHTNTTAGAISAKILVYCESGNDRSTVFVVAFLMVVYGLEFHQAMQLTQARRGSISVNEESRRMLSNFETILRAERQVFAAQQAHDSNAMMRSSRTPAAAHNGTIELRSSVKRGLSVVEDEDHDMEVDRYEQDGVMEVDGGRRGTAPFKET